MAPWLLLVASWRTAGAGVPLPWIGLGLGYHFKLLLSVFIGSWVMFHCLEGPQGQSAVRAASNNSSGLLLKALPAT